MDDPEGKASSTPPAAMKWGTATSQNLAELRISGSETGDSASSSSGLMMRSRSHESNLQHRILKSPAPFGFRAKTFSDLPVNKNKSQQNVSGGASSVLEGSTCTTGSHNLSTCSASPGDDSFSKSVYSKYLSPTSPSPIWANMDSFNQAAIIQGGFGGPPKSPRTGRLTHSIPHQFQRKFLPGRTCFICQKQLGVRGEKCKSCRVKVHTDCKGRLGNDTCGLTKEHARAIIHLFLNTPVSESTGGGISGSQSAGHLSGFETPSALIHDASVSIGYAEGGFESSSSANSSTPSTPAPGAQPSPFLLQPPPRKFTFSEVHEELREVPDITVESEPNEDMAALIGSQESDMTLKSIGSGVGTGSERTLSQEEVLTDSIGSQVEVEGRQTIRRNLLGSTVRGGSSWQDVTIKIDKIEFPEDGGLVGHGLFGVVKRGYYFMDVAVKFLNMEHVEYENRLEAFKQEVAPFKNTRHENIVLLIGYCLEAPNLGIVMNFCKGRTLHTILYNSRDRLELNKVLNIAAQITQGMSYLHGKHILHKDLRTKNIFLENNKVVITDFGLFSVRRLVRAQKEKETTTRSLGPGPGWDRFPLTIMRMREWCVLPIGKSPTDIELVKSLYSLQLGEDIEELPFSFASDVYAFGIVLYELLSGDYPFKKYPAEAIVWQVGRGIKPQLNNLQTAKEFKDILMNCWAFQPMERPDFNELFKTLERLPRKRLARSPSHPVHLSRSYESMF